MWEVFLIKMVYRQRLTLCGGGNRQPIVIEQNKNARHQQDLVQSSDGICRTIPAGTHGSTPHLLKTTIEEPKVINPLKGISGNSWQFEQQVYDPEGIARSVKSGSGSGNIPKIITHEIQQTVKVRKYEVDTEKLKEALRNAKKESGLSYDDIKNELSEYDIPITTVEHWFRRDNCFSIPQPEVWLKLKEVIRVQ